MGTPPECACAPPMHTSMLPTMHKVSWKFLEPENRAQRGKPAVLEHSRVSGCGFCLGGCRANFLHQRGAVKFEMCPQIAFPGVSMGPGTSLGHVAWPQPSRTEGRFTGFYTNAGFRGSLTSGDSHCRFAGFAPPPPRLLLLLPDGLSRAGASAAKRASGYLQ